MTQETTTTEITTSDSHNPDDIIRDANPEDLTIDERLTLTKQDNENEYEGPIARITGVEDRYDENGDILVKFQLLNGHTSEEALDWPLSPNSESCKLTQLVDHPNHPMAIGGIDNGELRHKVVPVEETDGKWQLRVPPNERTFIEQKIDWLSEKSVIDWFLASSVAIASGMSLLVVGIWIIAQITGMAFDVPSIVMGPLASTFVAGSIIPIHKRGVSVTQAEIFGVIATIISIIAGMHFSLMIGKMFSSGPIANIQEFVLGICLLGVITIGTVAWTISGYSSVTGRMDELYNEE